MVLHRLAWILRARKTVLVSAFVLLTFKFYTCLTNPVTRFAHCFAIKISGGSRVYLSGLNSMFLHGLRNQAPLFPKDTLGVSSKSIRSFFTHSAAECVLRTKQPVDWFCVQRTRTSRVAGNQRPIIYRLQSFPFAFQVAVRAVRHENLTAARCVGLIWLASHVAVVFPQNMKSTSN